MQVETIKMDPEIAEVHYKRYRDRVKANKDKRLEAAKKMRTEGGRQFRAGRAEVSKIEKEDEELKKAYYALKQGKTLINLHKVMEESPNTDEELPSLAIARADWEFRLNPSS